MALAFQRQQVGFKETTINVTVPENPKAKLMYYLGCIASVLDLDELPQRYRNYNNYYTLTIAESRQLLQLCKLLPPQLLKDKCIFEMNDLAGMSNRFFELSSREFTMVAARSVMIAGRNIQVLKIMAYTPRWRHDYYDGPIVALERSLNSSSSCIIL